MFLINNQFCFQRLKKDAKIFCGETLEPCCEEKCPHGVAALKERYNGQDIIIEEEKEDVGDNNTTL